MHQQIEKTLHGMPAACVWIFKAFGLLIATAVVYIVVYASVVVRFEYTPYSVGLPVEHVIPIYEPIPYSAAWLFEPIHWIDKTFVRRAYWWSKGHEMRLQLDEKRAQERKGVRMRKKVSGT